MSRLSSRSVEIAELEQLYRTAPEGLCLMDCDPRFVRINGPMARINGLAVEDHIGRTLAEIIPAIAAIVGPLYPQVIEDATPMLDMEIKGRTLAKPEEDRIYLASYFPEDRWMIPGVVLEPLSQTDFHQVTLRNRTRSGAEVYVDLRLTILYDEAGEPVLVIGCSNDITEKRALQEQLLRTAGLEQRRIGQELHDVIGQELLGLGYLAQSLASSLSESEPAAAAEADRIVDGLERSLGNVRALSKGLIPVTVTGPGLADSLREMAEQIQGMEGVTCTASFKPEASVSNDAVATQLYRIAQESVTNALKHGRAKKLHVRVEKVGGLLNLKIQDDGVGLDTSLKEGDGLELIRQIK